jgi:hypothetical protein
MTDVVMRVTKDRQDDFHLLGLAAQRQIPAGSVRGFLTRGW